MRSILLVGSVGAGKTTLRQRLLGGDFDYAKTQAIEVHDGVIDTPGEFLESRFYKNALINASWEVESVVLVQAAVGALHLAGASRVFCIDSITGDGVEELLEVLCHR